jgi:nitrite reductase/ring-hydroxylating ferredoxin subunit/DMSO/TMAO reductase YedYZ heme-binding membrane subunit
MSAGFQAVQWNRRKLIYDAIVLAGVALVVGIHMTIGARLAPPDNWAGWVNLRINALGFCAFLMITLILCIGPLARLDPRLLPLLYNRRHFGVMAFFVALAHGLSVMDWFRVQDALPDFFNELTTSANYTKFIGFTTKALGITALSIFFLMAITSHDYWLRLLTPRFWKGLHMAIYVAYGVLVMHVSLGVMQEDRSPIIPILLSGCFLLVTGLHVAAGWRGRAIDRGVELNDDGWLAVGEPLSIPDRRARIIAPRNGERIAVFRDGAMISAVTNLCAHQEGPLGEGRVVNGCIVCPWHGYEYRLIDGCAPPPFDEKLATYRLRLKAGVIEVDPRPLPPGTAAALTIDVPARA